MKDHSVRNVDHSELSSRDVAEWTARAEELETGATYAVEVAERTAALLEAAEIWERVLSDPFRAFSACERVLEVDPFCEEAVVAIMRLCQTHGFWDDLLEFFRQLVERTDDRRDRAALLGQVARVQSEGQQDQDRAFATLLVAFGEDVMNEGAADVLEAHARRFEKVDELLASYVALLDTLGDHDAKVSLCARLGRWYMDLGHFGHAIPFLVQALKLSPDHWPALEMLAAIYRRQERWEPLTSILSRIAKLVADTEERKDVHVTLGELYEKRLGDPVRAAASYREALSIDPSSVVATKGLTRTGQDEGDWRVLRDAIEQQIAVLDEREVGVPLLRELARINLDELDDAPAAIEALKEIVVLAPDDSSALEDLDDLLSKEERWEELVDVLDTLCTEATAERRRVDILLRLASVLDECLSRTEEAVDRLEELLELDPSHEAALAALAKTYRDLERWDDLVRTTARQLDAADDPDQCIDLYIEQGRVNLDLLDDPRQAIEAWERARRLDARNVDVLEGLAEAYERVEAWNEAREVLEHLCDLVKTPEQRIEHAYRLATLFAEPLDDQDAAVSRLEQCLELDPHHVPSLTLLKDIRQEAGEWSEAARLIEALLELVKEPVERSRLLAELSVIQDVSFKDPAKAQELLRRALELDPKNLSAVGHLAEIHVEAKRYGAAMPLLAQLLRKDAISQLDDPTRHRVYFLRGYTAQVLGQDQKALASYRAALQLDPIDLETLRGLAALHTKRKEWHDAYRVYELIDEHHRQVISTEEVVEVLHRLGVTALHLGDDRTAVEKLEAVLELEPGHRPSLEVLLDIHEKRKDWRRIVATKRALLADRPGPERVAGLVEAATIYAQQLNEPSDAIECLEEALSIKPGSVSLLRKLVELYTAQRAWDMVIETIQQIIELLKEDSRIAVCHRTIASLYRDELGKPELAVKHYELCLDHDPSRREAFEAIESILTEREDWRELTSSYRRMLERFKGDVERTRELQLLESLGNIHLTKLEEVEPAAEAYEAASLLEPMNIERHAKLAELYVKIPGAAKKAIAEHRFLITEDPMWVTSYMALSDLYRETGQFDEAWCMCATLCFLGQADATQRRFYEDHKDQSLPRRAGALTDELWRDDLVMPDERCHVGAIFEAILPAVRRLRVQPLNAVGLGDEYRFDPAKGSDPTGGLFVWTALTMGLQPPALYLMSRQGTPLLFAPTDPPASIADVMLLSMYTPDETRFEMGRHVASYRTEHYVRCLVPTLDGLRDLFLSAVRTVRPEAPVLGDIVDAPGEMAGMLRETLTAGEVGRLSELVDKLLVEQEPPDVTRWLRAVEHSECRAGLLLSGDLAATARALRRCPPAAPGLSLKEVTRQLVAFSVSEAYFRLRRAVGFYIEPRGGG